MKRSNRNLSSPTEWIELLAWNFDIHRFEFSVWLWVQDLNESAVAERVRDWEKQGFLTRRTVERVFA